MSEPTLVDDMYIFIENLPIDTRVGEIPEKLEEEFDISQEEATERTQSWVNSKNF